MTCKPGVVNLWSPGSPHLGWSGHQSLPLHSERVTASSSLLQPVSGLHYVSHDDALILSLFDGSLHVVHRVSSEPSWTPAGSDNLSGQTLSKVACAAFMRTDLGEAKPSLVNRISGLLPYDGQATFLWAHEYACYPSISRTDSRQGFRAYQPANFRYDYDSQRHNMVTAAQLYSHPDNDAFLAGLTATLATAKTSM